MDLAGAQAADAGEGPFGRLEAALGQVMVMYITITAKAVAVSTAFVFVALRGGTGPGGRRYAVLPVSSCGEPTGFDSGDPRCRR